jgi:CMP-N-acetylneuraminic acid synthetase
MKYKKFYMPKALPYEIPPERGLMIDTEFEFKIAEFIVKHKLKS